MASESGDAVGVVGVVPGGADAAARDDGGAGLCEVISGGGGHLVEGRRVTHYSANLIGERAQEYGAEEELAVCAACEVAQFVA